MVVHFLVGFRAWSYFYPRTKPTQVGKLAWKLAQKHEENSFAPQKFSPLPSQSINSMLESYNSL
ncbi:hypothetical protein I7I50_05770 [Histoplasma capsulatum G186AR]|uniref:Uncharacterized protein n=1 Tax=Ajellomyces capsulatus TaxID=5037 RepID=A0A8H8D8Y6_AJECA|nr:hypothetical protein I7I52_04029 [Histoplasma capsulatum]QSS76351.1 hypothetical protein I7I50_05770 [Histoplasma capsulatum G186AR]